MILNIIQWSYWNDIKVCTIPFGFEYCTSWPIKAYTIVIGHRKSVEYRRHQKSTLPQLKTNLIHNYLKFISESVVVVITISIPEMEITKSRDKVMFSLVREKTFEKHIIIMSGIQMKINLWSERLQTFCSEYTVTSTSQHTKIIIFILPNAFLSFCKYYKDFFPVTAWDLMFHKLENTGYRIGELASVQEKVIICSDIFKCFLY